MSDHQVQSSWDQYDLITEEHDAILESSSKIDQARDRIRQMAFRLHDGVALSRDESQWLINMAFTALSDAWMLARSEEYKQQRRQEQSQKTEELLQRGEQLLHQHKQLLKESHEQPPYEPVHLSAEPVQLPAWLLDLDQQKGGQ